MLIWIFGRPQTSKVYHSDDKKVSGFLQLEKADVRWFLSLDKQDLPQQAVQQGNSTFRSIQVDGDELEFSGGFTDLHTRVYEHILEGKGFGITDAQPSIQLAYDIRYAKTLGVTNHEYHPLLKKIDKFNNI